MTMLLQVILAVTLLLALTVQTAEGRLRKYEDTLCILTGQAPRDAREAHVFETTRTQRCQLFAGPNTIKPGRMTYAVVGTPADSPKKFTWRLEKANIEIDSSHLDMGSEANEHSHSYIHLLDDADKKETAPTGTAVTGMVLGAKLGGSGRDPQNLFPQSALAQPQYHTVEDSIYECIRSGKAHHASLEWKFLYQTGLHTGGNDLRTRAYSVWYHARFFGEHNTASSCTDIELHLDN